VASEAESLCCVGARSVVEITREVTILSGKDKGQRTQQTVLYLSSLEMAPQRAASLLDTIREYWTIEGGLHQRLDVTACEDASRVRHPNSLLVLGILRRSINGIYEDWKRRRKNKRQSTLKDFHDAMNAFNHRQAFTKLTRRSR
jgi:predicted transposase YbfD/YdcC